MTSQKKYELPRNRTLVLLTALAVTLLFTLPRLAVFYHVQGNLDTGARTVEFVMRAFYSFAIAVIILCLNLGRGTLRVAGISYNPASATHRLLISTVVLIVVGQAALHLHLALFDPQYREKLFRFFFNLSMILETVMVIFIAHIYRLLFNNMEMQVTNEQLLKANAESRYEALRNQVNPHFLFNSLNTASALIQANPQRATEFINDLSDVYRYVLESSGKGLVTVSEEVKFAEAYRKMLAGRFGNKIIVDTQIAESLMSHLLPAMSVQLLIENAIKHNSFTLAEPLFITIRGEGNEIAVSNVLHPKKYTGRSTNIGLSNLNQRAEHLCGRPILITRTSHTFTVIVPLKPHNDHTDH